MIPMTKMLLFIFLILLGAKTNYASGLCNDYFSLVKVGMVFHKTDATLYKTKFVEMEQQRKISNNEEASVQPANKIADWLKVLEQTHLGHTQNSVSIERLRSYYQQNLIIKKEEIPQSYYDLQVRIAREQGHGTIRLTDAVKNELAQNLIDDQKDSLNNWFDYFLSSDSSQYPFWAKYWAFNSITKLSKFDPELGTFLKRSKGTAAPFPELNRESLAKVVDFAMNKIKNQTPSNVETLNFKELYSVEINKFNLTLLEQAKNNIHVEGRWVKYDQGSEHLPLVESLKGQNTGWCTAGESTAKTQLGNGDFYVYYSVNEQGSYARPRVAIRMEGDQIAEVRGIGKNQNLDPHIAPTSIVDEKLKEFGNKGDVYRKKSSDMKRLTEIDKRHQNNEELTREDFRFLYEIDSRIDGFGYNTDPRIDEILLGRNKRKDIAWLLDTDINSVFLGDIDLGKKTEESILNKTLKNIKKIFGTKMEQQGFEIKGNILVFREIIKGDLRISQETLLNKKIKLPRVIMGKFQIYKESDLHFFDQSELNSLSGKIDQVESTTNLQFPENVVEIELSDLNEIILQSILDNKTKFQNLIFPRHGNVDFTEYNKYLFNQILETKTKKIDERRFTLKNIIVIPNYNLHTYLLSEYRSYLENNWFHGPRKKTINLGLFKNGEYAYSFDEYFLK